jgi:DNA invertase Pin-like site-specific DNA recombinase
MAAKSATSKRKNITLRSGVIYARYSSHAQKDVSIEQQVEECMDFAKHENIEIVEVYADRAISGKSDRKRTDFKRMTRDAEAGKFQVIVSYKSNRISRNMLNALMYESKMADYGIKILYAKEEFGNNAAGRFALRSMMNVNQFYSENMAEDIMRGLLDNAANCMVNNGSMPFGYRKGADGKFAIDPVTAPIAREIFKKVLDGVPFVDIANDLNARGIKTSRGNLWNKNSFHRMVINEHYIGVYQYSTVRIEDGVPPIIEKELFYAMQKKLNTKSNPIGRTRENGEYLLTGKLFCGHCKSPMVGMSGTSARGPLYHYYECQKHRVERACTKKTVRREWIEEQVVDAAQRYVLNDSMIETIANGYVEFAKNQKRDTVLEIAKAELASVEKGIKNIISAIEEGVATPSMKERLFELERQKKNLESTVILEAKGVQTFTKEQVLMWLDSFRNGDLNSRTAQKKLIDAFVLYVYLFDGEIRIVFSYAGKKNTLRIKQESEEVAEDLDAAISENNGFALNLHRATKRPLDEHLLFSQQFRRNGAVLREKRK